MTMTRIARTLAASFAKGVMAASFVLMAFSMQARAQAVGDEVLYGVTGFQDLYTIDIDTGAATFIGNLGYPPKFDLNIDTHPRERESPRL